VKRRLIRDRVTLASVTVLAFGLVVLGLATNLLLTQRLDHDASAILRERTEAQLAALYTANGRVRVRPVNDVALDRASWTYTRGRAIERPPADPALQRAADQLSHVSVTTERPPSQRCPILTRGKPGCSVHWAAKTVTSCPDASDRWCHRSAVVVFENRCARI